MCNNSIGVKPKMKVDKNLMEGYRKLGKIKTKEIFEIARAQSVLGRQHIANEIAPIQSYVSNSACFAGGLAGLVGATIPIVAGVNEYYSSSIELSNKIALTAAAVVAYPFYAALGVWSGSIITAVLQMFGEAIYRHEMYREFDKAKSKVIELNKKTHNNLF